YSCKRLFVQRKAMHKIKPAEAAAINGPALRAELSKHLGGEFTELTFAQHVTRWQLDEQAHGAQLDLALRYAAWAAQTPEGKAMHRGTVLFKAPHKLDYMRLVPAIEEHDSGYPVFSAQA